VKFPPSLLRCIYSLMLSTGGSLAVAAPTPSIVAPTVNVAASSEKDGAAGALVISVDGLKAPGSNGAAPDGVLTQPRDLTEAAVAPPVVTFDQNVLPLAAGATQRRWVLPFKVFNMPAGLTLSRYVTFKVDGIDWALAYQLASPPAITTTWSLKPAPTTGRSLMTDDANVAIPISITIAGNLPVTGLRIVLDPVEQQTRRPLSKGGWRLCKAATNPACADEPISLSGAGLHTLWAKPTTADQLEPGKYEGMLTIASSDKSTGESISFSVNVSSRIRQLAGLLAITLGVGLATYVSVFIRLRVTRNEMLEAAVSLREVHDNITSSLRAMEGFENSRIARRLEKVNAQLTDEALLLKGLPARIPSPWTRPSDSVRLDAFKRHIEAQAATLNALSALVESGLQELVNARRDHDLPLTEEQSRAYEAALRKIDALADADPPSSPAALLPMLTQEVQGFKDALRVARLEDTKGRGGATMTPQPRTLQELRLRMAHTNLAAWAFLLLVTILVGGYVLILSNPGFGTELDLLACLLWGLGLQTGAALASATTSTVSTAFNVVRPQ
jgi:hypothetical protein